MNAEAYHVAFDVATEELREIVHQFEQLRIRKEQIEKVVEALRPVVGLRGSVAVKVQAVMTPMPVSIQERFDAALAQVPGAGEATPIQLMGEGTANQSFIHHNGEYFAG
jgi:hypothetical protein